MRCTPPLLSACAAAALLANMPAFALDEPFAHCGLGGVRYEAVDLGTLGEGVGAAAINDRGEVTGTASLSDTLARAFIWDCERGIQNIGAVDDGDYASIAYDINNRGQVVGQSVTFDDSKAFIWDRAHGMRGIGSQTGGLAYDVNDRGDVLMMDNTIWSEGLGSRATQDLIGFYFTSIAVTNDRGHILGLRVAEEADYSLRFFDWSPRRGREDFAVAPNSGYTEVAATNNRGDIIGYARNAMLSGSTLPYLVRRDGEFQFLTEVREGIDGQALSINDRRQIVGSIDTGPGGATYLWDPKNGLRSLSELLSPSLHGWVAGANDINNWGWMSGGLHHPTSGERRAVMFVPVRANSARFKSLSTLKGAALCRALDQVKLDALVTCLLTGR
jgi:probable HAF family extracellular repeat protein